MVQPLDVVGFDDYGILTFGQYGNVHFTPDPNYKESTILQEEITITRPTL
jgi:hypothetical protein